ncbi:dihydropyrimidinase [Paracraurococcus ruber]|uniref:Dihydropyrimidinase n=1 Tax=Paracraurococcus ruber TaxID=77675 RepID=A0ABS1D0W3_9PROT|nr:dihydropyrimidinase [Paracraurococcus ruber]MBK1660434.1 dihydropyrimidinase [Paracraurococcus ruber]TDG33556.1 dihydropyrimidinase [Paracraurococcus ruber]
MPEFDLVIRNGRVATASDVFDSDVGIAGGQVVALARGLGPGAKEIDARGKLVLPGGVDSHTHIEEPRGGPTRNADTFASGSASAAVGGTTTVIGFARQERGGSIAQGVAEHMARAAQSRIDYSFHMIFTDPRPEIMEQEVPKLVEAGHRSFKIFLTYAGARITDDQALEVLAAARRLGALVCIHAEHHDLIEFHTRALLKAGLTWPKYHAWAKPMVVERECVHRVCAMAEALDVPIQVFHVSGAESAEEIERAQARGLKVWGETCTQYLVLTAEDLDRPGFEGAKYVCSPAPRSKADQAALWDHISRGVIQNVTSDHAPTRYAGADGKSAFGESAPFTQIPNGLPGLAARMPILFSEGVAKGRIDLPTFVSITATHAAKLFGLHPRKGTIAVGSDADIAIWDPARKVTITQALLQDANDHTPFEGIEVTGWPETTLVRGVPVVEQGKVVGAPGHGQFLPRGPYAMIKPRGVFPGGFNPVDGVPA